MSNWDVLIKKADLRLAEVRPSVEVALSEGQVRVAIESFSITANNITYGAIGDQFGYWKFFPAPEGFGRIPVWGFATVVESKVADAPVGLRLFGYLPMSTHLVMELIKTRHGYVDTAAHRAELPPTYNAYNEAPVDKLDDYRSLLRPLLMTSFLLDDFLSEDEALTTLVLSSASSKTAMGLAWFAKRRGRKVIGLSSPANLAQLEGLGLYDQLLPYDQVGDLASSGPTAFIDFAGNRAVVAAAHAALGDHLTRSLIVGGTHWEARGQGDKRVGPEPVLFFAPDQIRKRASEWGPTEVDRRFTEGLVEFVAQSPWLNIIHHHGSDGLLTAYAEVVDGRTLPQDGHIISPV